MATFFWRFHRAITVVLFLIAGTFYFAEMVSGAVAFSVLGGLVELVAWVSKLGDIPETVQPAEKEK
jgi:hypothetical protein